jgi:uracil-DNA glycosylase
VKRLLIVGEDFGNSPARYHSDKYALTGASGERLAELAGVDRLLFYAHTDRTNVVELAEDWRDKTLVSAGVARITSRMDGRRVVLLGARVADAMGASHLPLFEWRPVLMGTWMARAPHPSGRNRLLNDSATVAAFSRFLKEAMRGDTGH